MAAFLAQAAVRRTPVVLDGVVSGAAALLAEELAPGARSWWLAGHRSTEPAHTLVLEQLDLTPLLELNMRLGEGSGATAAIPLLTMAVQVLTDMATFADAGVSGGPAGDTEESLPGEVPPNPGAVAAAEPEFLAPEATGDSAGDNAGDSKGSAGDDSDGSAGSDTEAGAEKDTPATPPGS
jgi:hypothetical protein